MVLDKNDDPVFEILTFFLMESFFSFIGGKYPLLFQNTILEIEYPPYTKGLVDIVGHLSEKAELQV